MSVVGWSESSRTMRSMCAERGIAYVHVLQPTLHDPGSKPLTPEEIETGQTAEWWRAASTRGYPLLREEGKRLREEHDIVFVDASLVFRDVPETLYYDHCHFGRRGNEILARPVADGILESLRREAR